MDELVIVRKEPLDNLADKLRTVSEEPKVDMTFGELMDEAILYAGNGVDVSGVTATAADVLAPKIFVDANEEEVTGTIVTHTADDLTVNGATISTPAGYYASDVSKSVTTITRASTSIITTADDTNDKLTFTASNNQETGYVTGSNQTATKTITLTTSGATATMSDGTNSVSRSVATATQATPSITVSSAGLITASATQTAGYVAAGTKSATKQLTVQAAQTITPSTSNKTIASGRYLTGTQTIKGDSNLKAANIKSGVSIFGVSGSLAGETIGVVSKGTIVVTYPSGATCTVYNSSGTTYTALDTSGVASFIVAAGTWTVKITKSGQTTKTKSVTVAAGKYVEVELLFELVLYDSGDQCTSITGGWKSSGNGTVKFNSDHIYLSAGMQSIVLTATASTVNRISIYKYSKVNIFLLNAVSAQSSGGEHGAVRIGDGTNVLASMALSGLPAGQATLSFDPTAFPSTYYIELFASGGYQSSFSASITKVWLS